MYLIYQIIFSLFLFNFLEAKNYFIKRSSEEYEGDSPLFIDWTQPRINPPQNSFYYKSKPYSEIENGERIYPNKYPVINKGKEKEGGYGPFGVGLFGLMKGDAKNYGSSDISPLSWLQGLLFGG
ncbi:hypothetical protein ACQ4LE_000363 [Meloidogyne hapla]